MFYEYDSQFIFTNCSKYVNLDIKVVDQTLISNCIRGKEDAIRDHNSREHRTNQK